MINNIILKWFNVTYHGREAWLVGDDMIVINADNDTRINYRMRIDIDERDNSVMIWLRDYDHQTLIYTDPSFFETLKIEIDNRLR